VGSGASIRNGVVGAQEVRFEVRLEGKGGIQMQAKTLPASETLPPCAHPVPNCALSL